MSDAPTLVVGGGVAGLLTSLLLARRGHRCELFDAGPTTGRGCSRHAGGMLAPLSELDLAEPVLARLGLDAVERWREILGDDALGDLFDASGSLLVAHRPEWPLLDQLAARARSAGLDEHIATIGSARITELEPWMAGRLHRGIWIAGEGVVHPDRLLPALRDRATAAGVVIHDGAHVEHVAPGELRLEGGGRSGDTIIDCRGLGARSDLPLRGVRGEYVIVRSAALHPRRPVRLMHPRYPLYVVPRPDGRLYIGATQLESENDGPVHVRSALELLSALYSLAPGFADAEIEHMGVGLRPAFASNLPVVRVCPGLISLNGLFRHGFLLAPRLAAWVADTVDGQPLPRDAGPFWQTADRMVEDTTPR